MSYRLRGIEAECFGPFLACSLVNEVRQAFFVNQELYGAPSHLPWAIYIDPQHRLPGFQNQATYQPLFLYESIWDLLNMAFLLWLGRRYEERLKPGDLFLVYLIIYPLGRFFLEFLRLDASQVAGINANQTLMLVTLIVSATVLIIRHWPEWKKGLRTSVSENK